MGFGPFKRCYGPRESSLIKLVYDKKKYNDIVNKQVLCISLSLCKSLLIKCHSVTEQILTLTKLLSSTSYV